MNAMKRFETASPRAAPMAIAIAELISRLRRSTRGSKKDIRPPSSSSGAAAKLSLGGTGSAIGHFFGQRIVVAITGRSVVCVGGFVEQSRLSIRRRRGHCSRATAARHRGRIGRFGGNDAVGGNKAQIVRSGPTRRSRWLLIASRSRSSGKRRHHGGIGSLLTRGAQIRLALEIPHMPFKR